MKTTYFVTIHDSVFLETEDETIAYRTANLYRKLGLEAEVTDKEPV